MPTVKDFLAYVAYDKASAFAKVYFGSAVKEALDRQIPPNKEFVSGKLAEWKEKGIPFNFTTAFPERLLTYIPLQGVKLPSGIELFVNGRSVPLESYCLRGCPVLHYAFIEDYVIFDSENEIELRFEGLAENSFMGLYFEFPDVTDGMKAVPNTVEEKPTVTSVHSDPSLIIDSLEITPETIPDTEVEIAVKVKTDVPTEDIESVYFLQPTRPQMSRLKYDARENCWKGFFKTGRRCLNIFCNTEVYAWIRSKNGGIGPKKYSKISISY